MEFATQVRKIIYETFQIDESHAPQDLDSDNIEAWDSLGHLILISNLERELKISFEQSVIPSLWSEALILNALSKLNEK